MKDNFFYREYYKRNLPHFQPENGIFFITIRLSNSLPNHILLTLKEKKESLFKSLKNIEDGKKIELINEFSKHYFEKFDEFLIKNQKSPNWLQEDNIAEIIKENLFHWNEKNYKMFAYCIMPNHVHLIIKPIIKDIRYESLNKIMFRLKSYTANRCNKLLKRNGQFWHHESYDHSIRNSDELSYYIDYVLKNPVKAGFVLDWKDWKYNWVIKNRTD